MKDCFKAVSNYCEENGIEITFRKGEIECFIDIQDSDNQLHAVGLSYNDIKRSVDAIRIIRLTGWRIE
jgi:hypothetical protein